jgi:hypothetical protein
VAVVLGGAAPDAGLPGGQGVGQAPSADRAPETDGLGGKYLRQRGAGHGDRKEELGIFAPAGAPGIQPGEPPGNSDDNMTSLWESARREDKPG